MAGVELAQALADTSSLTAFEGKAVRQVGVEIPGVAGGLREAMKIEPQQFSQGEEGYIVLHWKCAKVRFEPIDKDDPAGDQRRVHVFAVDEAAIIDGDVVADHLAAQRERIELAKEAAAGIARLGNEDQLRADHREGLHDDGAAVDDCPVCWEGE